MVDLSLVTKNGYGEDETRLYFDTTPVWKIIVLSIVTNGFYDIVWSYNIWRKLAKEFGYKVSPGIRAVFIIISNFWLFKILEDYFSAFNKSIAIPGIGFALVYLLFSFCTNMPSPFFLLAYGATIVIVIIQTSINTINRNNFPHAKKNNWSSVNTIWLIIFLGFKIWILT